MPQRTSGSGIPQRVKGLSRRATIAGAPLALAAALAACGGAPEPELVTAAPPPAPPRPGTEIERLIGAGQDLTVGGEGLNATLLQSFYARRGFEPVWTGRQTRANALVNAVMRAGDQGLDPERFHAGLLRRRETLSPLERELLLTDAVLAYAEALAGGAVRADQRRDYETLTSEPVDVAAILDAALDRTDPAAVIEALAPTTPTYRMLRQALLRHRPGVRAGGIAGANLLRKIEVNLERQRWLPRQLPADRVWVNVADQKLVFYRADQPVFTTRVVVGEDIATSQSPEFRATIEASFFNPPWIIPADIVSAEIMPKIDRDPEYLTRNNMVLRDNGEIEQLPGPQAGLGLIMFDMPNRFDVYLHDTPNRVIFARDNRRLSHGCIRVQNPFEFAALLMQQPIDAIHEGIAQGGTVRNTLPTPVPVFVTYQTAFADADETLQLRPDFYNRDAEVWRRLQWRPEGRIPTGPTEA